MVAPQPLIQRGAVLAAGDIAGRAAALLAVLVLARRLGDVSFGQLAWAMAVASYVAIIMDAGLATLALREVSKQRDSAWWYSRQFVTGRLLLVSATVAIALPCVRLLPLEPARQAALTASLLWLIPLALGSEWVFQALGRTDLVGLARFLSGLNWLLAALVWVAMSATFNTAVWTRAAGEVATVAVVLPLALRLAARYRGGSGLALRPYLRQGMPIALTVLTTSVYAASFDILILGLYRPPAEVGWYAAAYRLYLVIPVLPKLLIVLFFPRFAAAADSGALAGELHRFQDLALRFGLPLAAFTAITANPIVLAAYGPSFLPAAQLLQWLTLAGMAICFAAAYPQVLLATGYNRDALLCVVTAVVINLLVNLLAIPHFGAPAAAAATIASELSVWPIGYVLVKRRHHLVARSATDLLRDLMPTLAVTVAAMLAHALILRMVTPMGALTHVTLTAAAAFAAWGAVALWRR